VVYFTVTLTLALTLTLTLALTLYANPTPNQVRLLHVYDAADTDTETV
jgi:hypothetical protein